MGPEGPRNIWQCRRGSKREEGSLGQGQVSQGQGEGPLGQGEGPLGQGVGPPGREDASTKAKGRPPGGEKAVT